VAELLAEFSSSEYVTDTHVSRFTWVSGEPIGMQGFAGQYRINIYSELFPGATEHDWNTRYGRSCRI